MSDVSTAIPGMANVKHRLTLYQQCFIDWLEHKADLGVGHKCRNPKGLMIAISVWLCAALSTIIQSINQSSNQLVKQSISQSVFQLVNPLIDQSITLAHVDRFPLLQLAKS